MLEMIKQVLPLDVAHEAQAARPADAARKPGGFDQFFGVGKSKAAEPVGRADKSFREDDRPELGSGWDASDVSRMDNAEVAAAQAAQTPPARSADTQPQPTEATGQGGQNSSTDAQASQEAPADPVSVSVEADLVAQTGKAVKNQVQAEAMAQQVSLQNKNPSTAADSAAPTGGGASIRTGTDAGEAAVLQSTPVELTADDGQTIEQLADPSAARPGGVPAEIGDAEPDDRGDQAKSKQKADVKAETPDVEVVVNRSAGEQTIARGKGERDAEVRPANVETVPLEPGAGNPSASADMPATTLTIEPGDSTAIRAQAQSARPVEAPLPAAMQAGADAAQSLPTPDVDVIASRTMRWQRLGMLDQSGMVRIRLEPPELGSVQVALRTAQDVVRVHITVASEAVRQLLTANSDRLSQSLQAHGLQAGQIEIVVAQPPRAEAGGQQGGQSFAGGGDGGSPNQQGNQSSSRQDGRQSSFAQQAQDELNVVA